VKYVPELEEELFQARCRRSGPHSVGAVPGSIAHTDGRNASARLLWVRVSAPSARHPIDTMARLSLMSETSDLLKRGLQIRREVVGEAHVDQVLESTTPFSAPMQELVTEYCWGWLWSRPGLPRKTRSLLNLAMLSILNRPNEFKSHVRGAIANGCTVDEIRETLLQAAVYGGVPVGIEAFRLAAEALSGLGIDHGSPGIEL
jgi:4-carboxymuconolactone decarboxylase